jgi:copper chaperone CopZ
MELGDLKGVQSVTADLDSKQVSVQWDSPATWEQIEALLAEINYPAEGLIQLND